jgi:hypothetical protein
MQEAVATLCQRHDCNLTLDLFTTAANHQCPRFRSRFHDVDSQGVDAFAMTS